MSSSTPLFTQIVNGDSLMDYDPGAPLVASSMWGTSKAVDSKPTSFSVIHDVARPSKTFLVPSSSWSMAKPVPAFPLIQYLVLNNVKDTNLKAQRF